MKRFLALLSTLFLAGTISSCGSSTSTVSEPTHGPLTWLMGADDANHGGLQTAAVWNKAHPTEKVTIKLLPSNVTDMHAALVDLFSHQSSTYDLISGDIIWAAEFGSKGWVDALDRSKFDTSSAFSSTVDGLIYKHQLYGVPWLAAVGAFYYRKDLVPNPPTTWAEMIAICPKFPTLACYDGQFKPYEGLSVNVEEAIYSAGGDIINADGKVVINSENSLKGLEFLSNGFKQGYIPANAITHDEGSSIDAFRTGQVLFMRGWNYFYPYLNQAPTPANSTAVPGPSVVKGKFGVLPPLGLSEHGSEVPGETPIELNHWAHNKATAFNFMQFTLSYAAQRADLEYQTFPVNRAVYENSGAIAAHPEIALFTSSYIASRPRPVIPRYADASEVLFTEAYKMLQGKQTPRQTLDNMDRKLKVIVGK